jgi:hypothetical protein
MRCRLCAQKQQQKQKKKKRAGMRVAREASARQSRAAGAAHRQTPNDMCAQTKIGSARTAGKCSL